MPRSRANTRSRRYPGSVLRRHSCMQDSAQNVRRPLGTSFWHHRQMPLPFGPRCSVRPILPPGFLRSVLIKKWSKVQSPKSKVQNFGRYEQTIKSHRLWTVVRSLRALSGETILDLGPWTRDLGPPTTDSRVFGSAGSGIARHPYLRVCALFRRPSEFDGRYDRRY